jgi:hypothetical protein
MKDKKIIYLFFPFLLLQIYCLVPHAQSAPRFVDNGDNTVTDNETFLMWRKNTPSPMVSPAVTWNEALAKCEELDLGGYRDWRLPTVEEWATIIDTNNQAPALAEPNPFENVIVSAPYWSSSDYIFGPDYTCDALGCPLKASVALLYLGYFGHQNKDNRAFVWPVRSTMKIVSAVKQTPVKQKPPVAGIVKEKAKRTGLSEKGLLFIQPELLSKEFEIQGIEKQKQVRFGPYLQMSISENSKAVLKPQNTGIKIDISIYEIDQRRVNLFNNSAMTFELPVRLRIEPDTGAIIFYKQP